MCCAEWIQFTPKNRQKENIPWFGTDSDRSERDEVGERDGAERRQRGPELHTRLMTKLSCSRFPLTVTTGDGRSTPAAAGWRSCAAGVPTGRSAASASSAPSSVGEKGKKREQTSSPQLSTSVLVLVLVSEAPRPLTPLAEQKRSVALWRRQLNTRH